MTTGSEELFRKIQEACAGHTESDMLHALLGSLAVGFAVAATDKAHAAKMIRGLPAELKPRVAGIWDSARVHRAVSEVVTSMEDAAKRAKPARRPS